MGAVVDPITEELVAQSRDAYRMFQENDPAFLRPRRPRGRVACPRHAAWRRGPRGNHGGARVPRRHEGLWDDAYPDPEEFLPSGDKLVVLGTWRARARSTGVRVEVPFAHIQQFRDGKLVYYRNYLDAAKALQSLE